MGNRRSWPSSLWPVLPLAFSFLLGIRSNGYPQTLQQMPPPRTGNAKLQSILWDVASAAKAARKPVALPLGVGTTDDGRLILFLVPESGQLTSSIDTKGLQQIGGEVLASSDHYMRVAIPPESLERAAEIPGVRFIRTPIRPQIQGVVSEGADKLNAIQNHSRGVKGKGVKVAVIDVGFSGGDKRPEDLPANVILKDFTRNTTSRTTFFGGSEVHGTACAEVVYDVAPEATLYLVKIDDIVHFEQAKDYCIAEKVDVISHSANWLGSGFGDGKGEACDIANDAIEHGILWVNSAGNFARTIYQARFASDNDNFHDFAPSPFKDLMQLKGVGKGDTVEVYLTWNEWPVTSQDYDLLLYRQAQEGDELQRVKASTDRQVESPPTEHIEFVVTEAGRYFIAVYKHPEARTQEFKVWSYNRNYELAYPTLGVGSIGMPGDAKEVVTVGAVSYLNWGRGPIEDYSSQGPTYDGRTKPDLVAPSRVSSVSYGSSGFGGTSASAPHVAGAAALLKCANPTYTRSQLVNALLGATVDLGDKGKDNVYGAGKLVLPLLQSPTGPRISSVSPQSVKYGETLTIRGQGFGTPRGRVAFKGGTQPNTADYVSWTDTEIRVRIPIGARKGDVQLFTSQGGTTTATVNVTSPWIGSVAPATVRTTQRISIAGENFGRSASTSSVNIGAMIPPTSISAWSDALISLTVPINTRSARLFVVTDQGNSNPVGLVVTSPYLTSLAPSTAARGAEVTLVGGNFGSRQGSGYVLFGGIRAATSDYVSWGNSRIALKVPAAAQTADVKVVTANGESGSIRLEVAEEEVVYRLPYLGTLGYSPPLVTGNPKGVTFEFEGVGGQQWLVTFELGQSSAGEVALYKNGVYDNSFGVSGSAAAWLNYSYRIRVINGKNTIEFRNTKNSTRSSGYDNWSIRNIQVWKPFDAKLVHRGEGQHLRLSLGLGNPYPSPFNSEVTVPYSLAQESAVRVVVYDLAGQKIRTLFDGVRPTGTHLLVWDGRNEGGGSAASGVYVIVADTPHLHESKRVVLLR